jgi:hypothetical protein
MRALFTLSLLLLVPALASAKPKELTAQRFAKGVAKAVSKADAKAFEACCHPDFWSASADNGKLLWKQLTGSGLSAEFQRREQRVTGERSLLPLALSKGGQVLGGYVLRIDYRDDRWGISAADEMKPAHDEWLAGGLKQGTAKTAQEAVSAFLEAVATKDKPAARLQATEASWHPPGDTLFSLYRQAVRKSLGLKLAKAPLVKDSRAVALVDVSRKGRVVDQVVLYLVKRSGWLIAAIDEDEEHGRSYLEGKAAAKVWPSSPRRLANTFDDWQDSRQAFRSLWSEAAWKKSGRALFERLGSADPALYTSPRDRELASGARVVIVIQTFAQGEDDFAPPGEENGAPRKPPEPLEQLFLLAQDSPAGWRFVGLAKDAAAAKVWREGK